MRIKFTAKTMPRYAGHDGKGNAIDLTAGDTAEVTDAIGKLLVQRFGGNFEIVVDEKPAHAPESDKALRKTIKTKTK